MKMEILTGGLGPSTIVLLLSSLGLKMKITNVEVWKCYLFGRGDDRGSSFNYAIVCVEIHAYVGLIDDIGYTDPYGNKHVQQVIYEWRPPRCSKCCNFGHITEKCHEQNLDQINAALRAQEMTREKNGEENEIVPETQLNDAPGVKLIQADPKMGEGSWATIDKANSGNSVEGAERLRVVEKKDSKMRKGGKARKEGGKYYLVGSGYPNTIGYLAPYKDKRVRYHMPTFRNGDQPTGVYEKFNYRHSSLRTTIERAFGILKKSWKILKVMPQVSDKRQSDIIIATFTMHNFIRMHNFSIPILANEIVPGRADSNLFDQ
ncbi:hypothetical protein QQ045_027184 [Rhodiola kirilowii]